MEVQMLPTWANVIFAIALVMLSITSLSQKIKIDTTNINSAKAYYAFATVVAVALAAIFVAIAPPCYSGWYLTAVGLTIFLATLLGCGVAMDGGKNAVMMMVIIAIILIVFYSLLFGNVGYAAIWLATVGGFIAVGQLFFPNKKEKE